jgi:hypothetical protein
MKYMVRRASLPGPVRTEGALRARAQTVRGILASPRLPTLLALIACITLVPALWLGLVVDDFFQRLAVEGRLGFPLGPFELFSFAPRDAAARAREIEIGFAPWWTPPTTQLDYYRPLASLTHAVDYAFWPTQAWLMHLENLGWYAALIVVGAAFYREWLSPRWVAGLAAALYAFDHAHAAPVAWIANRNALMSTLFGVLSLMAHRRWRAGRGSGLARRAFGAGAFALFALTLFSGEAGISMAGYLAAFALCVDDASAGRRLASLAPYGVVVVGWRILYRALGHGVVGSEMASDALLDPIRFAGHALQFLPILLVSDVFGVPGEVLGAWPRAVPAAAVASYGVLALVVLSLWPTLRRDRGARFLGVGAVLSAVPIASAPPSDRYVFWEGIGIMGLIAQLGAGVLGGGDAVGSPRRLTRAVAAVTLAMRGLLSPLLFPMRPAGTGYLEDEYERIAAALPSAPETARRTVVLVNAPFDLVCSFLPILKMARHEPLAEHMYLLRSGLDAVTVVRTGARSLELRRPEGWRPGLLESTFRTAPFRQGDRVDLEGMSVEVRTLAASAADRVVFTFPVALEDPSLVFLAWGAHGPEPFALPRPGETAVIAAPPALIPGGIQWAMKDRAIEPD